MIVAAANRLPQAPEALFRVPVSVDSQPGQAPFRRVPDYDEGHAPYDRWEASPIALEQGYAVTTRMTPSGVTLDVSQFTGGAPEIFETNIDALNDNNHAAPYRWYGPRPEDAASVELFTPGACFRGRLVISAGGKVSDTELAHRTVSEGSILERSRVELSRVDNGNAIRAYAGRREDLYQTTRIVESRADVLAFANRVMIAAGLPAANRPTTTEQLEALLNELQHAHNEHNRPEVSEKASRWYRLGALAMSPLRRLGLVKE
jgi:hypothetical protein